MDWNVSESKTRFLWVLGRVKGLGGDRRWRRRRFIEVRKTKAYIKQNSLFAYMRVDVWTRKCWW